MDDMFQELVKQMLIDRQQIGVLNNMHAPVCLNYINGALVTLTARTSTLPSKQEGEDDAHYAALVAEFIKSTSPDAKWFAWYELREVNILRYGVL